MRDPFRSSVAVHIPGLCPDDYRIVQLSRREARRLAALLLYQAERPGDLRKCKRGMPGAAGHPASMGDRRV